MMNMTTIRRIWWTADVQVQNLTPQLVNAGTIKMTYPENKVLIGMITIKTVFEDEDNGLESFFSRLRTRTLRICESNTPLESKGSETSLTSPLISEPS